MRNSFLCTITMILFLVGCANPLNRATSDNYAQTCAEAERNGRLDIAEEACYRAAVNVDWGNLGSELRSERLYNLGRIKRRVGKFSEAEQIFLESLEVEETLSSPSSPKVGRRLVELSVSLAAQEKWEEGSKYLERVIPIAGQFFGTERSYIIEVFSQFSAKMDELSQPDVAAIFESKAAELR